MWSYSRGYEIPRLYRSRTFHLRFVYLQSAYKIEIHTSMSHTFMLVMSIYLQPNTWTKVKSRNSVFWHRTSCKTVNRYQGLSSWTTLNLEPISSSIASVPTYRSTQCHISEDGSLSPTSLGQSRISQVWNCINYDKKDYKHHNLIYPKLSNDSFFAAQAPRKSG